MLFAGWVGELSCTASFIKAWKGDNKCIHKSMYKYHHRLSKNCLWITSPLWSSLRSDRYEWKVQHDNLTMKAFPFWILWLVVLSKVSAVKAGDGYIQHILFPVRWLTHWSQCIKKICVLKISSPDCDWSLHFSSFSQIIHCYQWNVCRWDTTG